MRREMNDSRASDSIDSPHLTNARFSWKQAVMKCAACLAALVTLIPFTPAAYAGGAPVPRETKDFSEQLAAPAPQRCNWQGFYLGLNLGGAYATSDASDLDGYNLVTDWAYDMSAFTGGGQAGYNMQFGKFVFGVEADAGYLGLDGTGVEPGSPGSDTFARTKTDFYTTLRARAGFSVDCWLFYLTGGGMGASYEGKVVDDCVNGNCGGGFIDASSDGFRFGWTVGGGVEWALTRHWSIKTEYLYFDLANDRFSNVTVAGNRVRFDNDTDGHIVRVGLNFRF
jgi:outer membrane immunogenic protein